MWPSSPPTVPRPWRPRCGWSRSSSSCRRPHRPRRPAKGGDLLERVKGLRRKLATEQGLIIPPVRTRDNVHLDNDSYAIRLHGVEVATGIAPAGRFLAIGGGLDLVPGRAGRRAGVRPPGQMGAGRAAPAGPRGRRDGHRPLVGHHHAPGRGGEPPRRPAAVHPAGEDAARLRQGYRPGRDRGDGRGPGVVDRPAPGAVRTARRRRRHPRPRPDHRGGHRAGAPSQGPRGHAGGGPPRPRARHHRRLRQGRHAPHHESRRSLRASTGRRGATRATAGPSWPSMPMSSRRWCARSGRWRARPKSTTATPYSSARSRLRPSLRRLLAPALPRLAVLSVNELGPQVKLDRIGVVNVTPAEVV